MRHNQKVTADPDKSIIVLLDSIFFYHKSLLILWKATHDQGIDDKILVHSMIRNLDDFSQFIRLLIRKYEESDRQERDSYFPSDYILWMEDYFECIHEFSHCVFTSECQQKKITHILSNIYDDIKFLSHACKSFENDPSTIWFAQWITCTKQKVEVDCYNNTIKRDRS